MVPQLLTVTRKASARLCAAESVALAIYIFHARPPAAIAPERAATLPAAV